MGKNLQVKNVSVRWLSQTSPDKAPEYGLRFFTIGPGGSISIHNQFYYQTMYVLEGRMSVASYDLETDQKTEEKELGLHDWCSYLPWSPTVAPI